MLGAAWAVLNPLSLIIVYTVVFSEIMRARLPGQTSAHAYSIYLCAGLLSWNLFAEIVTRSMQMFIDQAHLLKKVHFSRACLPVVVVINGLIQYAIVFSLFLLFALMMQGPPGWPLVGLLPALATLILFGAGLGLTLGVLNVFFRDVAQFFGVALQFWFWMTPVVYPPSIVPEALEPWLWINPMYGVLRAFQDVMVQHQWPDWALLAPAAGTGLALAALGAYLFRRHAGEMADEL